MKTAEREIRDTEKAGESSWLVTALILLLVAIFTAGAYHRVFDNEFVDWDDFTYVVSNNLVRGSSGTATADIFTRPVSSNYHPLTVLSLRLNNNSCTSCPHGISPTPFIRWNVIVHVLNTMLVFILVYLLSGRKIYAAFFVAAVFGVHPVHVESVAWISERKDVLYSFFFLLGLLSYLHYKRTIRFKAVFYFLTFVLFVFSCLSKAVAVVFPLVLILIDYLTDQGFDKTNLLQTLRKLFTAKKIILLSPFLAVSLFVGLLAYHLQNGENFLGLMRTDNGLPDVVNTIRKFTLLQRIGIGCYGFVSYVISFLVPSGLSALYPYPPEPEMKSTAFVLKLVLSTGAVIAAFIAVIYSMRKTRIFAFGAAFYLITIVLVLQFISVGIAIRADRYSYLPYIGLAFIVAMVIAGRPGGVLKKILIAGSMVFIVVLWFLTVRQADVWQNTETLWTDVAGKYPEAETPRASRGKYYTRKALQAVSVADKAFFEEKAMADFAVAVKGKTKNADVYEGMGYLYASRGDYKNALEYLNRAIMINPGKGSAYYNRALVWESLNKPDEAIADYTTALRLAPLKEKEIRNNRSNLLLETGRFRESIEDLDYLIREEPSDPNHYFNRAMAGIVTGDMAGAEQNLKKVLSLNPQDEEARKWFQKLQGK